MPLCQNHYKQVQIQKGKWRLWLSLSEIFYRWHIYEQMPFLF
jgi:hypothetical protein